MIRTNHKGKLFVLAERKNGESSNKMSNVRMSIESFEEHYPPTHFHQGKPHGSNSNYFSGNSNFVNGKGATAVGTSIDLVTPQWSFLSNNDKSNKEAHSFTPPPPPPSSHPSSILSPSSPLSATYNSHCSSSIPPSTSSCASANDNTDSRNNRSSVSEEEIIKPLKADNSEEEYGSSQQKGQQQQQKQHSSSTQSPHQLQALVLTHDQRKMKRRRGGNYFTSNNNNYRIITRDRILSSLKGRGIGSSSFSSSSLLFGLIFIIASLIHSSHEQSFFSPSSDEWDGSSFRSGTYGNGYTCVNIPVNFTLCKNIGYTKMMIPNLLGHDSLQEAEFHAKSWVPLLGLQCHPDTQLFLCSLFSPICLDRPIYPCRSLCQGVQAKCEPRMLAYNYPWPSMLKCDQFPEDHDLCIRPGAANKSDDPELECPSCNQAHTCENIVDNFCRADFVFRAKYKKSKGAMVEFRKERWFKPREGNRRGRELRTLSLDSKDDCCATKMRQGFPYIVMGIKRGDDYIITFAMQWNPKDRVLKNAVRTFRSMDCTNPLPMSVTAAGGKLGAARNGTNTGAGRRRRRKQGRRRDRQYGGCRVSAPGRNN